MLDITVFVELECIGEGFSGIMQELRDAEPQSFRSEQEFHEKIRRYVQKSYSEIDFTALHGWLFALRRKRGRLFCCVEILYCQHYTWQGRLTYGGGEAPFTNQLELVAQMKEAFGNCRHINAPA